MNPEVFISYSSRDKVIADVVCAALEGEHIRCWIAPRDVSPGADWAEAIMKAIVGSRVMILVFSAHANSSRQVRREVQRASEKGLTVIPLRVEEVAPVEALEFYIGSVHWLDAWTPPLEQHLHTLAAKVRLLLPESEGRRGDGDRDSVRRDEPAVARAGESAGHMRYRISIAAAPPRELKSEFTGMVLVRIEPGTFLMGSPDTDKEANDNEKPRHWVRITRPFYLGECEVTQDQYRKVTGKNPSAFEGDRNRPVEQVSWADAVAFCNALSAKEGLTPFYREEVTIAGGGGYRLPTEAEWEYACRAGSSTRYSFGDDAAGLGEYAWFGGNSGDATHPVGQKRPNGFGLYDMHGNVWEWCWDGYEAGYYRNSPADDPRGPSRAPAWGFRGGGWNGDPRVVRSAIRIWFAPGYKLSVLGFRVARVPSVEEPG